MSSLRNTAEVIDRNAVVAPAVAAATSFGPAHLHNPRSRKAPRQAAAADDTA